MWMLAITSMVIAALFMAGAWGNRMERETPQDARVAVTEVANYRTFAMLVARYLADNPGYVGSLPAATLLAAPSTPDTFKRMRLPPDWKAVVVTPTDYTLCTSMSNRAVGSLGQIFDPAGKQVYRQGHTYTFVVADDVAKAEIEAAKCD